MHLNFPVKAARRSFYFLILLAASLDKSGMCTNSSGKAPGLVRACFFFFSKLSELIFNTNRAFCMMHGNEVTYRSVVMLFLQTCGNDDSSRFDIILLFLFYCFFIFVSAGWWWEPGQEPCSEYKYVSYQHLYRDPSPPQHPESSCCTQQTERVPSGHNTGGEKVNFCLHHQMMNHFFPWQHCCLLSPQHKFKKGTAELFPECITVYLYKLYILWGNFHFVVQPCFV